MTTPPDDEEDLTLDVARKRLAQLAQENGVSHAIPERYESSPEPPPGGPPLATIVRWCPRCAREAPPHEQHCGRCALPLHCPRCKCEYQIDNRFCSTCGLDPARYGDFLTHLDQGRRLFQQARYPGDAVERLRLAAQASQAFGRARESYPEDRSAEPLAAEAQRLTTALLWELCDTAQRSREFSRVLLLLERLALEPAEQSRARARIQELLAERTSRLADATNEALRGKWDRAVQVLTELQQGFPDDPDIARLLAEYREKAASVDSITAVQIPQLRESRRIEELTALLNDLARRDLNLAWVTGAIDTCQKRLKKADELVSAAEWLVNAGHDPQALAEINRALELVADHSAALQLRETILARLDADRNARIQFGQAVEAQRWFAAERALNYLAGRGDVFVVADAPRVQAGVARANHFLSFVAWAVFGGLLLLLAARMALVLEGELFRWLPERFLDLEFLTRPVLRQTAYLTVLSLLAYLVLAFLLACFRKPLAFATVVRDVFIVLGVAGTGSLMGSSATEQPITGAVLTVAASLRALGAVGLAALLGGLLGACTIVLAGKLLPLPGTLFSPLHRAAIGAGALAGCLGVIAWGGRALLLTDVSAAVILYGLLGLAGTGGRGHFYLLALAAVLSSGAVAALAVVGLGQEAPDLRWAVAWVVLAAAACFISPERRWPTDAVCAAILTAVALVLHALLSADFGASVLVSAWLFICGTVAGLRFPPADHRLHLLDRLRWRP